MRDAPSAKMAESNIIMYETYRTSQRPHLAHPRTPAQHRSAAYRRGELRYQLTSTLHHGHITAILGTMHFLGPQSLQDPLLHSLFPTQLGHCIILPLHHRSTLQTGIRTYTPQGMSRILHSTGTGHRIER